MTSDCYQRSLPFSKFYSVRPGINKSMFNPFSSEDQRIHFANSADPDEMAHYEPSHQELHYLPLFFFFFLPRSVFRTTVPSKVKDGRVHIRKAGVNGLVYDLYTAGKINCNYSSYVNNVLYREPSLQRQHLFPKTLPLK